MTPPRPPIAIVGIGCRFPGGVHSPATFWRLLLEKVDAIGEIPADRFDLDEFYDPRPSTPGKVSTRYGGFLEGIDGLDADFFGIAPREAERLDPQQRLLLEVGWEALEDAGMAVPPLAGSPTGVFVGMWLNDYEGRLFSAPSGADFYMTTGSGRYAASGRLSYAFGFQGPSITIDTACSSSLAAVHLACQSLWLGESDLALAGGANVILQPHISVAYSQSQMLAPDGRCKFGDSRANGYVRSEGAALVVLKELKAAQRDGDRVYAVILGGAVNNDGRSSGFMTTPGQGGQEEMLRKAYERAGVSPGLVQYVEAHGTGTRAGDPVELGALGAVLAEGRVAGRRCAVGSVKTNFGHTEGAAGVAGLIKTALALHHGVIPASLHLREPSPEVPWASLPLYVPQDPQPWPDQEGPALAGVSAFGISGTNAHIVLAKADRTEELVTPVEARPHALLLSAHSPAALRAQALRFHEWLNHEPGDPVVRDVGYTAARRRSHLAHRLVVVGRDGADWANRLGAFARGEPAPGITAGHAREGAHRVVFVFPGQGGQWLGMGRELLEREPVFRAAIERWEAAFRPYVGWSLTAELTATPETSHLDDISVVQPTLFAVEVALAELWRSWGVEPNAVVGHSMGEAAAAFVAGVLSADGAARVICTRSALLRRISGRGAMAVVELSLDEARAALDGFEDRVSVAVSNSARSSVISGDPGAIDQILSTLEARDVFCRRVKVDVASHSPQVEPLLGELTTVLADLQAGSGRVPLCSTVLGGTVEGSTLGPAYWARNLREPVRFAAAVQALLAEGHDTFIEMGPHPVLLGALEQELAGLGGRAVALPSTRREADEQVTLLESLGALHASGVAVDWARLYPEGRVVALPAYAWQRERYWLEDPRSSQSGAGLRAVAGSHHPLLGWPLELADRPDASVWECDLTRGWPGLLYEHGLGGVALIGASAFVELIAAAAEARFGAVGFGIEDLEFRQPLVLEDGDPRRLQVVLSGPDDAATLEVFSREASGWVRHAAARVRPAASTAGPDASLAALRARCTQEVPRERFYAQLAEQGLRYGEDIRGVRRVWLGPAEALVECEEGSLAVPGLGQARLPPLLLDACFQVAATAGLLRSDDGIRVPVRVGRLELPIAPVAHAWLSLSWKGEGADRACSVQVLDEQGRELASLRDIQGVALGAGATRTTHAWRHSLYEVEWPALPSAGPPTSPIAGRWLVLADRAGVGEALASQLRERGASVTVGHRGDGFRARGPSAFELRPGERKDAAALLEEAAAGSGAPLAGVVHLWALDVDALSEPGLSGCGSALALLQELAAHSTPPAPRLFVVTRGAQAVGPEHPVATSQAALWGLGRVASEEHPEVWGGLVDLDPACEPEAAARTLVEHLSRAEAEDEVAFRGGVAHVPRLARRLANDRSRLAIRRDASYLVTGGLGGLGLRVARYLAQLGARRIVLLGRHGLPSRATWRTADLDERTRRRVDEVLAIERLGAAVQVAEVDIADPGALAQFLDGYRRDGWPPFRGVAHCAGTIDDRLLANLDGPGLEGTFRAKAEGAWHLDRAFADQELDFFALFSSIGSLVGQAGQGNYAAANAFLDALAHERRRRGKPALSFNWGVWSGLGFADSAGGQRTAAELERRGIHSLDPEEALAAFGHLLGSEAVQVAVLPVDWAVLAAASGPRLPRLLSRLATSEAPATTRVTEASPFERLRGAPIDERREQLEDYVQQQVAVVLKQPAARIDRARPLRSLGMDSLMALELRRRLEAATSLSLSATLVWNHPTVSALATYLASRLDLALDQVAAPTPSNPAGEPAAALVDVARLSDEEALQALLHPGSDRS